MPEAEHVLREAPYLLTDARRRGWGLRCSCGWRSPLLETSDEALASGRQHVLEAGTEEEHAGPKGFFARRRARKRQRAPWDERRHD